jgi:hypothetical protein
MSGRKIDDHSSWVGAPGKGHVFPDGPHKVKMESSAEGAGHLGSKYPDTTEQIKQDQEMGIRKAEKYPIKTGYRN